MIFDRDDVVFLCETPPYRKREEAYEGKKIRKVGIKREGKMENPRTKLREMEER
jgi:hypothetical protein